MTKPKCGSTLHWPKLMSVLGILIKLLLCCRRATDYVRHKKNIPPKWTKIWWWISAPTFQKKFPGHMMDIAHRKQERHRFSLLACPDREPPWPNKFSLVIQMFSEPANCRPLVKLLVLNLHRSTYQRPTHLILNCWIKFVKVILKG